MEPIKDALGTMIVDGDYLVYPGRYSSSCWLNFCKVLSYCPKGGLNVLRTETRYGGGFTPAKKAKLLVTSHSVILDNPDEKLKEALK